MKNVVIIISILTLLISCKVTNISVKADTVKQETLIAIHSKIQDYGTLYFLKNNGDNAIFIQYEYKTDTISKKAKCRKIREIECELNDEIIDKYMWYTADSFKKEVQIPSWEKSFNCIFENFLELTNDEKMSLFENLSRL